MRRTLLWPVRRKLLDLIRRLDAGQQRRLAWQLIAMTGVRSVCFERNGVIWDVEQPFDDIGWALFVKGGHQIEEIQALRTWMVAHGVLRGSRNVVIDAGANIGTTCIPLARDTGCRALAIEPVAANFECLRRNLERNGLTDRILLVKKAVARQPGTVRMRLQPGYSGAHFVVRHDEAANSGYEDVEADTLPGVIAAAGLDAEEVALVWADVQGCELDVIESGSGLWAQGVPLWAEVEPHSLRRQGTLEVFAGAVAAHFDRFIDARELMRLGGAVMPQPIREFDGLVRRITPKQINTDVLLLPAAWKSRPTASSCPTLV